MEISEMAIDRKCVRFFLDKRNALIVHFASVPLLSGKQISYPLSLYTVINDNKLELSCSVVQPRDSFGPHSDKRNATGMIGLILRPLTDESVLAVSDFDAGSLLQSDGARYFPPKPVTYANLCSSMERRGVLYGPLAAYNEWGIKEYEIRGLFVASTGENAFAEPTAIEAQWERLAATCKRFPCLRIYTFMGPCLKEIDINGNLQAAPHGQLYPP
jgi:hypothetical protein